MWSFSVHSHQAFKEKIGPTLYFNPGSPNDLSHDKFSSYGLITIGQGRIKAEIIKFDMNRLWAPWRESYISKIISKQKSCVFCRILADNQDKQHLIFIREPHAYAVLNLFPYSNGHCLIVPNRHMGDISKLSQAEYVQLMDLLLKTKDLLARVFKPQGFNIGMNLGRIAGAGILGMCIFILCPVGRGIIILCRSLLTPR